MKSAKGILASGGLVFGLLVPLAASGTPQHFTYSCVRLDVSGPGLEDAPTVLEFNLAYEARPDEFTGAELDMFFEPMVDDSPGLRGEQMHARFAGEPGWTNFADPRVLNDCDEHGPGCDATPYAARANMGWRVRSWRSADTRQLDDRETVVVELSRTGGNPEPLKEFCLFVTYTSLGDFVDSPDVGPPEPTRERNASDPIGSTVIDASHPPGHDHELEVSDQGLHPGGDGVDAGGRQPEGPESVAHDDPGSDEDPEQNAETAKGCSSVPGGPAPWGLGLLLLPLVRGRSRVRVRRG